MLLYLSSTLHQNIVVLTAVSDKKALSGKLIIPVCLFHQKRICIHFEPAQQRSNSCTRGACHFSFPGITVISRYLEVVGTIIYKFELPEVQIDLHFG